MHDEFWKFLKEEGWTWFIAVIVLALYMIWKVST